MAATVNPATGSNGLQGTDFRFKDGKAVNVLGQMHWAVKLKNMHVQKKRLLCICGVLWVWHSLGMPRRFGEIMGIPVLMLHVSYFGVPTVLWAM